MAENVENKLPPRAPGKPPVKADAPKAPVAPGKPAPAPKQPPKPVPEAPKAPVAPGKPMPVPKPEVAPEKPEKVETGKPAKPEKKGKEKPQPKIEEAPKVEEQSPTVEAGKPLEVAPEKPKKEKKAKKGKAEAEESKAENAENIENKDEEKGDKSAEEKPEEEQPENKAEEKVEAPEKPAKKSKEKVPKAEKPKKPPKPGKEGAEADKNLKVVEKALSVEELNQLKQRRIRNTTYALAAVVLVLVIVLIVIIFWPTEERVEAQYDLVYSGTPIPVEHIIYSEEVTGNIITFRKPLTVAADSNMTGFSSFIMKVSFEAPGIGDVTDQMYIRLSENHLTDVYDYGSIEATVGEIADVPDHQFYVDMALHDYVYFTNPLTAGDEAFPVLLGFLCKNPALLTDEIIMKVNLYGFSSETVAVSYGEKGSYVQAQDGTEIPADSSWVDEVKENAHGRKFDN